MVLVDTSVWVSHLRHGEPTLSAFLTDAEVMSHDLVIGEMACGHLKSRKEILSLLQALPRTPVVTQEELLHFIDTHSLSGLGIGFIDIHLLASAKLVGVPLWTFDKELKRATAKLGILHV